MSQIFMTKKINKYLFLNYHNVSPFECFVSFITYHLHSLLLLKILIYTILNNF